MTSHELSHFNEMVRVWKTKSLLFCLRYDPLIVFWRKNHISFIFIKTMSHDLLVQIAYPVRLSFKGACPHRFLKSLATLFFNYHVWCLASPSALYLKEPRWCYMDYMSYTQSSLRFFLTYVSGSYFVTLSRQLISSSLLKR